MANKLLDMAKAVMETAAERYRRIREAKAKSETLHDVTCPDADCGMVWKCRRVGVDFWVSSGILPMHLVETMISATDSGAGPETAVKSLAAKQVLESIEFASKVVKRTAVEPRIVEVPTEPNDISQEDVMTCCYTRILNWQMKGGDEAAGLTNFPQ